MSRNRNTKLCTICDKRIVITNSVQRKKWNGNCRTCKYIMDIFSLNGNRLKQYA